MESVKEQFFRQLNYSLLSTPKDREIVRQIKDTVSVSVHVRRGDKIGVVIKWIVIVGIISFIYGTPQLRTKFAILFRDLGDLVVGLVNNEEVSSNKLVEDALSDLGVDLNESDIETEENSTN